MSLSSFMQRTLQYQGNFMLAFKVPYTRDDVSYAGANLQCSLLSKGC